MIDALKNCSLGLNKKCVLVAVTKGRSVEAILSLYKAGIRNMGENRWQEAKEKLPFLPRNLKRHFIGRLQTNKAGPVAEHFDMVQSVDSWRLAEALEKACARLGKILPVLIEVNTSGEAEKGGVAPEGALDLIRRIDETLPHLAVRGLMTVAKHSEDLEAVRACFKTLRGLFETLQKRPLKRGSMRFLSMGMSDDYKIALEEGANMLRIGRALFE